MTPRYYIIRTIIHFIFKNDFKQVLVFLIRTTYQYLSPKIGTGREIQLSNYLGSFLKVKLKLTSDDPNANYVTKYDISFGRCYSVQLKPQVTALGVTKVEFRANLNIYIYLHHPGQYMDVDSKTKVMFFPLLYLDVQN